MSEFRLSHRQILAVTLAMATLPVVCSSVASAQDEPPRPPQPATPGQPVRVMNRKIEIRQPLFLPAPGEAERRILAALDEETKVEFIDTPLVDALQVTAQRSDIPVILDVKSLDDAGLSTDEPVSASLSGISLRSALKIILGDLGLTSVIEDEVLKVTTEEAAEAKEITRVYPVGDLVSSSDESSWPELAEAIQTGILKGRWQAIDGTGGTVSIVRSAKALVIRQTRGTHDQIVELLMSLREAQRLAPQTPQPGEEALLPFGEAWIPSDTIELPVASVVPGLPVTVEAEPIVISLQAGAGGKPAQVVFEGKTETISKAVDRISKLKRLASSSVRIRVDPDAEHKDVVQILDVLQKIGVEKLSISVLGSPAKEK